MISGVLLFNSFGLDMVYFITFSDTVGTVVEDIFKINGTDYSSGFKRYLTERTFWVLTLGVVILPICLKKELQELHIVSVSLFIALIIFIVIIFV